MTFIDSTNAIYEYNDCRIFSKWSDYNECLNVCDDPAESLVNGTCDTT
jgi:hypothetical protein